MGCWSISAGTGRLLRVGADLRQLSARAQGSRGTSGWIPHQIVSPTLPASLHSGDRHLAAGGILRAQFIIPFGGGQAASASFLVLRGHSYGLPRIPPKELDVRARLNRRGACTAQSSSILCPYHVHIVQERTETVRMSGNGRRTGDRSTRRPRRCAAENLGPSSSEAAPRFLIREPARVWPAHA